ncbi:hypothetical protein CGRA01v4_14659 [Colletotrichum graminicola]|nr:hypothetical protein CGRA01v4_14659 [Colletotrichum graminicola]
MPHTGGAIFYLAFVLVVFSLGFVSQLKLAS